MNPFHVACGFSVPQAQTLWLFTSLLRWNVDSLLNAGWLMKLSVTIVTCILVQRLAHDAWAASIRACRNCRQYSYTCTLLHKTFHAGTLIGFPWTAREQCSDTHRFLIVTRGHLELLALRRPGTSHGTTECSCLDGSLLLNSCQKACWTVTTETHFTSCRTQNTLFVGCCFLPLHLHMTGDERVHTHYKTHTATLSSCLPHTCTYACIALQPTLNPDSLWIPRIYIMVQNVEYIGTSSNIVIWLCVLQFNTHLPYLCLL